MPNEADRAAWRVMNADLVEFITTPANQRASRYIASLASSYAQWRSLTDAQTRAGRNVMRELVGTVAHDEAGPDDAVNVPNGVFTVDDGTEHLTYRIHTVRRGNLQGRRVIKRQLAYGEFKAFAFLTRESTVKVWRGFYEDEARSERYIVWARILVDALRARTDDAVEPDEVSEFEFTYAEGNGYTIQASVLCRRCNRTLTDPTSIALRIGPECRNHEEQARTTAANAHAPIPTVGELPNLRFLEDAPVYTPEHLASSVEATNQADIAFEVTPDASLPISQIEQNFINRVAVARRDGRAYGIYRERACEFCGRSNFRSPQGRGRHMSMCRSDYNGRTLEDRARIELRRWRERNGVTRDDGYDTLGSFHVPPLPDSAQSSITHPERVARRREPVGVGAPVVRTPNLTQLGTVIEGSTWEQ